MALGDGTKCKTFFWGPRMIQHAHWKKYFSKIEVWLLTTLRDPKGYSSEEKNYWLGILTLLLSGLICISSLAPTPVPLYSLQITSLWKTKPTATQCNSQDARSSPPHAFIFQERLVSDYCANLLLLISTFCFCHAVCDPDHPSLWCAAWCR